MGGLPQRIYGRRVLHPTPRCDWPNMVHWWHVGLVEWTFFSLCLCTYKVVMWSALMNILVDMGQPMVSRSTNTSSTRRIDLNRSPAESSPAGSQTERSPTECSPTECSPTERSPTESSLMSVDHRTSTSCLACGGVGLFSEGGEGGEISTICHVCKGRGVISRGLAASILSRSDSFQIRYNSTGT